VPTTGAVAFALTAVAVGAVLPTAVNVAVMVIGVVTLSVIAGSEYVGLAIAALVNVPAVAVHATLAASPSVAVTVGDVAETTVTGPAPLSIVAEPVVPFCTIDSDTMMPACPDAALCTGVPASVPFDGVTSKYRYLPTSAPVGV